MSTLNLTQEQQEAIDKLPSKMRAKVYETLAFNPSSQVVRIKDNTEHCFVQICKTEQRPMSYTLFTDKKQDLVDTVHISVAVDEDAVAFLKYLKQNNPDAFRKMIVEILES